tara:strand:- start:1366 stop:1935 length:570 start_codon:yes stop_codon:yes gene_type:complete
MSARKIEFLYQSLSDTQAIIRATDVKLGFLFAIVLLPITVFGDIYAVALNIANDSKLMMVGLGLIAILWFLSFYTLFLGVVAISNPYKSVSGEKAEGSFHGGDLFKFKFTDRFMNRPVLSKYTVDDVVKTLPESDAEIIQELVFEKIKTAYIRDIKTKRASQCVVLAFLWITLGAAIWGYHLFKVSLEC